MDQPSNFYGSQPNIIEKLNITTTATSSSATNSPKIIPKLTKTQSFKHQKSDNSGGGGGFMTPKLFRKFSFKTSRSREGTPKMSKKLSLQPQQQQSSKQQQQQRINENEMVEDFNRNATQSNNSNNMDFTRPSKRDITSAFVDSRGATLVNEYWGVSLQVPEGAIQIGERKEIYFVISDPRLCDNAPPLDLDNGNFLFSVGLFFFFFLIWVACNFPI